MVNMNALLRFTLTMRTIRNRWAKKKGQTLVEYALIIALISIVVVSIMISLGSAIKGTFSRMTTTLASEQAAAAASGSH